MKISKPKLFFICLVLVLVFGLFLSFTQRNTRPSRATGDLVTVSMDPATATIPTGQEQTVTVLISSGDQTKKISGTDIYFTAGGNATITAVDDPMAVDSQSQSGKTMLVKDIQGSEAHLSYVFIQPNADLPSTVSFNVTIKGTAAGAGTLALDTARSRVTGYVTGNTYSWGETGQGSYTFEGDGTGGGSGSGNGVTLNMKLKFQGVVKKPVDAENSIKVQVYIGQGSDKSSPQSGTFTADAQGIWTGTVTFPDMAPVDNVSVFVKGPKHLAKKFCDANPSETSPGTYTCSVGAISLKTGTNTFDFSGVYLLAGDLPEQNGAQNGIVDAYDISFVRLALGSRDAKSIEVADLNYDGIVDSQDYSLVIASLNVKYDEQ